MQEKINVQLALRVFQKVIDEGEKVGSEYRLYGLTADPGVDGYTLTLKDRKSTLTIFFHNHYTLDCPDRRALQDFLDALERCDKA